MFFEEPEKSVRPATVNLVREPTSFAERTVAAFEETMTRGRVISDDANLYDAYAERLKVIKEATGETRHHPMDVGAGIGLAGAQAARLTLPERHKEFHEWVKKVAEKYPDKAEIIGADRPISKDVKKNYADTVERYDKAVNSYAGPTGTGVVADLVGGFGALLRDPVQAPTLLLGPTGAVRQGARAITTMAVKQGLANAGMQAAVEPIIQNYRRTMGDEYGWSIAAANVAMAGAFGVVADGGVRTLYRGGQQLAGRKAILDRDGAVVGYESADNAKIRAEATAKAQAELEAARAKQAELDAIPDDVKAKAEAGDPDAVEKVLTATGDIEDPSVRGALNRLRMAADDRVNMPDIDDGSNDRILAQMLRATDDPAEPPVARFDIPGQSRLPDLSETPKGIEGNQHYREFEFDGKPVSLKAIDAKTIGADPTSFQFKGGRDGGSGASNALDHVEFDPAIAGRVVVYERADGKLVIADGHDRLNLASKIDDAKLDGFVFREKDGWTVEDVRAIAAKKNLMEGSGDLIDAVRAFRQHPEMIDVGMSGSTPWMREAMALSRLSDEALQRVVDGDIVPSHAALVADLVAEPVRHQAVVDAVVASGATTDDAVRRVIGETIQTTLKPDDLARTMGATLAEPHVLEARGEVLANVLTTIRGNPGLIGDIEAAAVASVIKRLADKPGMVSDVLNTAGRAVAEGQPLDRVVDATLRRFEQAIEKAGVRGLLDDRVVIASKSDQMTALKQVLGIKRAIDDALKFAGRILPDKAKVEVVQGDLIDPKSNALLDASSDVTTGEIKLATYAINPVARIGHEAVHTLRTMGLLSPEELKLLADVAKERGLFTREADYRAAYQGRDNIDDLINEEAAAHAVEARIKGEDFGQANTILNRLKRFFDRLGNSLRGLGFRNADDVTRAILSGEVARRDARAEWMRSSEGREVMAAISDRDTGRSMRADFDALGYYSKALEAAKGLKQAKGTPEQMLAQLKSAGVKQAEIEATNLAQFLDGKTSITRDEIVKHLTDNRVGVMEKVREPVQPSQSDLDMFARLNHGRAFAELTPAQQARIRRDNVDFDATTKWSAHSLDPSNPSYRETVLHLPEKPRSKFSSLDEYTKAYKARYPGASNIDAQRAYTGELARNRSNYDNTAIFADDFRSGHFSEPNIIGHMMTSMNRHEGKPVFTLDQIQSDWGQKLRDGGVRDEAKIAELKKASKEAESKWIAFRDDATEFARQSGFEPNDFASTKAALMTAAKKSPVPDVVQGAENRLALWDEVLSDNRRLKAELDTATTAATGHPLVSTTDQWTNTTLRRAIRQAAEADAEFIAIPHGDTVLSYNPGDEAGMQGFYGSRTMEGIVPKNLRKLLEKIDKDSAKPVKVTELETPSGMKGYGNTGGKFDKNNTGFTLFPLTEKVKRSVIDEGQQMFALSDRNLDMSPEARKARAEQMGFDTSRVWYHGTNEPLDEIRPGMRDPGAWFTTDLSNAANYARGSDATVYSVWLKKPSNPFVVEAMDDGAYGFAPVHQGKDLEFSDNVAIVRYAQRNGYDAVHFPDGNFSETGNTMVVFDASYIRDIDADFDPSKSSSPLLMAALSDRVSGQSIADFRSRVNAALDQPMPKLIEYISERTGKDGMAHMERLAEVLADDLKAITAPVPAKPSKAPADPIAVYRQYLDQGMEAADAMVPGISRSIAAALDADPTIAARISEALGVQGRQAEAADMLAQAVPQFRSPRILDASKPVLLTPEANARMADIRMEIDRTIAMLPRDVRVRVEDALVFDFGTGDKRLDGLYNGYDRLIYLAMDSGDPVRVMRHETIHALRQTGLMTDDEFATMYRFAERMKLRKAYDIDAKYAAEYKAAYGDRGNDYVEQLLREETVASMFADYSLNGRRFGDVADGGVVDRLIDTIVQFMATLRERMGGMNFRDVFDVFESIESGAMGARSIDDVQTMIRDAAQSRVLLPDGSEINGVQLFAIRAYHGSPHDFDRFSLDKIGTGEGAQAYGHGLYFAENEGVAKTYKAAGNPSYQDIGVVRRINEALQETGGDERAARELLNTKALTAIGRERQQLFDAYNNFNEARTPGRLYEVNIKADPNDFLDWDKPLSQQSEKVQKAFPPDNWADGPDDTGSWRAHVASREGARELRNSGVAGIRYLDQGSRSAGEGSRNYVVFDDSLIEIVAKDGKPVQAGGDMFALSDRMSLASGLEDAQREMHLKDVVEACRA